MADYTKGFDIDKMRGLTSKLEERARRETMENLQEEMMNIVLDDDLVQLFHKNKDRKVAEQSKRVIAHWVKKGLIEAEQEKKGGWFYFNRTETIWIDIITLLRRFGLDLDKIRKIRQQLFHIEVEGFQLINFALMYSILKEPYIMLVFQDGEVKILTTTLYSEFIKDEALPPHITFNFFHLAKQLYPNNNFNFKSENALSGNLTQSELKLLYYIRTGDFIEIKIRLKDGNISLFEGEKQINNPDRIMNIINEKSYQDIEIKTENGKIVHITATEKIKFKQ